MCVLLADEVYCMGEGQGRRKVDILPDSRDQATKALGGVSTDHQRGAATYDMLNVDTRSTSGGDDLPGLIEQHTPRCDAHLGPL